MLRARHWTLAFLVASLAGSAHLGAQASRLVSEVAEQRSTGYEVVQR